jgi:hypothetical protein
VEDINYQVFDHRATVGNARRIRVAGAAWREARRARRRAA